MIMQRMHLNEGTYLDCVEVNSIESIVNFDYKHAMKQWNDPWVHIWTDRTGQKDNF
jgi:hypothetical protein